MSLLDQAWCNEKKLIYRFTQKYRNLEYHCYSSGNNHNICACHYLNQRTNTSVAHLWSWFYLKSLLPSAIMSFVPFATV